MNAMSDLATSDRCATRTEVLSARVRLRKLAQKSGLSDPRVAANGTIVVHSDHPGYREVIRFAGEASEAIGVWPKVITDDVPAAEVATEPL